MVEVTKKSANWRLFGGGGLIIGGVLLLLGSLLGGLGIGGAVSAVIWGLSLIVVGVALFFVAFGQTGSNGAVGASGLGKGALVLAGISAVLWGIFVLATGFGAGLPGWLATVAIIALAVTLIVSAVVVFGRGVAKGFAKWALFVPAVLVVLISILGYVAGAAGVVLWLVVALGAVLALTGLAYLFNKADV